MGFALDGRIGESAPTPLMTKVAGLIEFDADAIKAIADFELRWSRNNAEKVAVASSREP